MVRRAPSNTSALEFGFVSVHLSTSMGSRATGGHARRRPASREARTHANFAADVIHSLQLAVCEEVSQAWLRGYVQVLTPSIVRLGLGLGEDDEVEHNL